jgi:hypothetical protein
MPKEIKEVKEFLKKMIDIRPAKKATEEAKKKPESVFEKTLTVKTNKDNIKFKLRTRNYLYTFKTLNREVAQKILKNLPPGIKKTEVKKQSKKIRK